LNERHSLHAVLFICLALVAVSVAACGGGEDSTTEEEVPTPLVSDTPFPTRRFEQPTSVITVVPTDTPDSDEAADLERGKRIYEGNDCGSCHGAQGEGVDGQAGGLAGTQLTEAEFDDILRTGGAGELGNEHLYGPQAISPSGMTALYAYVKSFSEP
jgi:mono/diheme cytochrome c family protein